jgi:AbrB family looped-hinge helix DNA binding protein
MTETAKIGRHGTLVIPAKVRRRLGLAEGELVLIEEIPEGLLVRPAVAMPVEVYSAERRAEFLLSNAVDAVDYAKACESVRAMGLDPEAIPHRRPAV